MPAPDDENGFRDDYLRKSGQDREVITLLRERQRELFKRIENNETRMSTIESKQRDMDALLNKGLGAIALITGAGVFIGWLISVGGNVFRFFR